MAMTEERRRLMYDRIAGAFGPDIVDEFMNHLSPHPLPDLATREDVRASESVTRAEVAMLQAEMHVEIAALGTGLKSEMAELRTEVKSEIAELRTEVNHEMAELRTDIKDDMAELRVGMSRRFDSQTKWSAGLVAANLATVVTVLVA